MRHSEPWNTPGTVTLKPHTPVHAWKSALVFTQLHLLHILATPLTTGSRSSRGFNQRQTTWPLSAAGQRGGAEHCTPMRHRCQAAWGLSERTKQNWSPGARSCPSNHARRWLALGPLHAGATVHIQAA